MINRAIEIVQRLHRGLTVHPLMTRTLGPVSTEANPGELGPVSAHIIAMLDFEARVFKITAILLDTR